MFLDIEKNKTYKRDNRTSFWVSIKFDESSGYVIYVAECLKDWFAFRFPDFYNSAGRQWLMSSKGKFYLDIDMFDSFDLDWARLDRVLHFLGNECFWPSLLKPSLGGAHSLDVCIVRDYTSNTNDLSHWTQMGGLFHNAKYERNLSQPERTAIIRHLSSVIAEMISFAFGIGGSSAQLFLREIAISTMPIEHEKLFDNLDYELCANVADILNLPLITPCIDGSRKRQVKGMSIAEKSEYWDSLIRDNCIGLDGYNVQDKIVILIDDLYQSGLSMEKTAQFLKMCGAYKVYGFACVKAMRDSDNT